MPCQFMLSSVDGFDVPFAEAEALRRLKTEPHDDQVRVKQEAGRGTC